MEDKKSRAIFSIKEITLIAIFTAATAVLSQISFPIPFSPVPISFGLVAVYIAGILLKPRHALTAQLCYLALGAVGAPVFSSFKGGISALIGPTGGYLAVYPIMALLVSCALNSKRSRAAEKTQPKWTLFVKALVSMCIAHILLYMGGTIWLSLSTGSTFTASLSLAVIPYIPLDLVKIAFCTMAIVPLRGRLSAVGVLDLD